MSATKPAEVLLQMELCPGSVIDVVLSSDQGVDPRTIQSYFTQVATRQSANPLLLFFAPACRLA